MGLWTKVFRDGSVEHGLDSDIDAGKASWSKGRLTDIIEVQISEKTSEGVLSVPETEWHHFDRYEAYVAGVGTASSVRIYRVIQSKILQEHLGQYICYNIDDPKFLWASILREPSGDTNVKSLKISEDFVGQWLSLQVSATRKFGLSIGERGKLYGHQQIS